MPSPRLARLVTALLLAFVALGAWAEPKGHGFAGVDPAEHTHDRWYLDTVENHAAGYWRSTLAIQGDEIVTTYHEYSVELHGGETSTYDQRIVWYETKDFKPSRIVVTTSAGSDKVKKTYRFVGGGIELTSEQNGRSLTTMLPTIDQPFLTAAQASIVTDTMLGIGKRFELDILDINVGLKPYTMIFTPDDAPAKKFKLADGTETQASLWTTTYSIFPGFEMKHWVDGGHNIVGLAYDIDGMAFASQLADEKVSDTIFDPPEMSGLSVVVPDRPIKDIDRQKKVVYELSYDAGDQPIVPISTALQAVEALGKGKARVTVGLTAKPQDAADDRPSDKHLASSIMVDHEDKVVRDLAKKAVSKLKPDASTEQIAKTCKRYVTRHINGSSLSVGDGSASEAARTREGDCTECAVLLAALLRANNIPSRCVNGLVYSEDDFVGQSNVFVYHMWTQAWIDTGKDKGYWLDLDSAMWRYSAGHIALGVSAMGDDDQQDLTAIIPMQQDLKIKVIETQK